MLKSRFSRPNPILCQAHHHLWRYRLATMALILPLASGISVLLQSGKIPPSDIPIKESRVMTESQVERASAEDFTQFVLSDSGDRPFRVPSYLLNQDKPQDYRTLVLGLGGVSPVTHFEAVTDDVTPLQSMQIENPVSDNLKAYLPSPDKSGVAKGQTLQQSTNPNGSEQWFYPIPALMWQTVVIVLTVLLLF